MNLSYYPTVLFFAVTLVTISPIQGGKRENSASNLRELSELKREVAKNNQKILILEKRLNSKEPEHKVYETQSDWPASYIPIPNSNSAIRLIFNPNIAIAYDASSYTADYMYPPALPLMGDVANLRKNRFTAQGRATQFGFKTLSHTNIGDIKTEFSLDFWGDSAVAIPNNPAYQPRLRFAYIEIGRWTVGQTTSNFLDLDAVGETVDYGSVLGISFRHGLVKYSFPLNPKTSLNVALERSALDYTDPQGNLSAVSSATSLPELTVHLKHEDNFGHVSLRGVARQLRIKDYSSSQPFIARKNGWGVGTSGKLFVYHKSNLFAQFNFGNGIGRYIPIINGQSSQYNSQSRVLDPQKATNAILGFEHYWNELFRSNIIYAYTKIYVSKFVPMFAGATRVTKSYDQLYLNLIYSPVPPLDVGIEYEYAKRKAVGNFIGKANRFTLGITYKF
ncbi:MAG: hypothetical protein FJX03_01235 [Alphaproteobacteria bacterium]|nr:hypothetical protein [Alphaproteobacteria bacterium]